MRLYSGGLNAMVRWFIGVASIAALLGACSSGGGPGSTCVCAVSVNAASATVACGASACVGGTLYSCGGGAALTAGAACSTDQGPPVDGGGTDSTARGTEAGAGPDAGGDVNAAPDVAFVTIYNYEESCLISLNGEAPSSPMLVYTNFPPGTAVTIVATANPDSPYVGMTAIGPDPWLGLPQNDGGPAPGADDGGGATESTRATITAPATKGDSVCVSLCCLATECPTANPCVSK